MTRYKCYQCLHYFDVVAGTPCPVCGNEDIKEACICDHVCTCSETIHSGVKYCPVCGEPICPCGSGDSAAVSRVTGYLADVKGWSAGKRQELKDRHRTDPRSFI